MQNLLLLAAISISVAFFACKNDKDEDDTIAPVLTISSPTVGVSISGAVNITGTLTDESLHELLLTVTDDVTGDTLYVPATDPEVHDLTSYTINETWTPSVTAETAVTLTVLAEDHSSNETTKTIKFKVKP